MIRRPHFHPDINVPLRLAELGGNLSLDGNLQVFADFFNGQPKGRGPFPVQDYPGFFPILFQIGFQIM